MGFGPSKIDYKERDFTKEPLDDQEIDILLQALPEENVIDSIESEGREKILRAMSDQKVFNIRGDNIFDYYFTNNKEDIKGCMTNRIKQNDVSKFMATLEGSPTMELTVQDCREYANSINAPFNGDYNNTNNPKGCFSQVSNAGINRVYYNNTSNEDTDCGAYGKSYCIEKNPTPTPCPDDNFNKMVDTIPGVINQPIQELLQKKDDEYSSLQSQHDTEKSALQSQHDTLNDSKNELQSQYDTLNDSKNELQTQYDTLNTSKNELQTQYDTLNTSKNELQTQYDTLNDSKTELQSQYDNLEGQKGDLESEIQKNLLSNVVKVTDGNNIKTVSEQQCKAYAKSLGTTMGKGNDTSGCYLAPHKGGGYGVYYNKKTGKGKCYYNSDSDYRVCIQNNLNRNNTYSKQSCRGDVGGEYDCRVDGTWDQITVKGWDRNKYGQTLDAAKHFCNTHKDCVAVASSNPNWNWPVHTTSKFKPCNFKEVGSGKPDRSVSKEECKAYAVKNKLPWFGVETDAGNFPPGCSFYKYKGYESNHGVRYNVFKTRDPKNCGDGQTTCIQKENCDPKMNYHTKRKCKKPIDGVWTKGVGKSCEWECPGRSGIQKKTVPKFRVGGGYACPTQNFTYNKDNKLFEGDHSDARNLHPYSTKYGCKRPSGSNFGNPYTIQDKRINFKSSCSDWDNPAMFYKSVSNDEEPSLTVSEEECKAYADTHGYSYLVDNWDSKLKGCSIHTPTNRVFYNNHETGDGLNCGQGAQLCIEKQYYKVTGSGVCDKPEDIVPQNECEKAAKSLGFEPSQLGFGNKGEHAQSGCFMDGNILFHFDNKWKGDNYKKVGDYGGRTYICKR